MCSTKEEPALQIRSHYCTLAVIRVWWWVLWEPSYSMVIACVRAKSPRASIKIFLPCNPPPVRAPNSLFHPPHVNRAFAPLYVSTSMATGKTAASRSALSGGTQKGIQATLKFASHGPKRGCNPTLRGLVWAMFIYVCVPVPLVYHSPAVLHESETGNH